MNRSFKPIFMTAVLAVFGVVNAQEAEAPAPAVEATVAESAPAAVEPAPVVAEPAPAVVTPAPAVVAPAPAVVTPAPAVVAPAPAAVVAPAPAAVVAPVPAAVIAPAPVATPVTDNVAAVTQDTGTVVLLVKEHQPTRKRRGHRPPKSDFAVVDVPANFEIQARKVMPVDADGWPEDNLNEWWGRANLMVLTESENFIGKVHLRMYPGDFRDQTYVSYKPDYCPSNDCSASPTIAKRDVIELHEAWAWHRGNYFNLKIGRWDNTTRFGSMTYGGYVDAKKDKFITSDPSRNTYRRAEGFLSTFVPENAVQFGFNDLSENISLDIALISSDRHLNRGDLRTYFNFKDLAGIESMNIGVGYRANIFDGIYDKTTDVTHTVSLGFRLPLIKDAGLLRSLSLFGEAAFIGLDDQLGIEGDASKGEKPIANKGPTDPALFPLLAGLDLSFYRGFDKIVIEAEYDADRENKIDRENPKKNVKDILGSIYVQKKLNDRFTLDLGVQSENNTKDFSLAARLQGRIN
ncbi:MAG: hypothetical protein LBU89_01600 [Fibromonadaceae bacterium]|jgi:hypothetical protein|nr:hypothetical protein [Fibromonadaceae bacterium]